MSAFYNNICVLCGLIWNLLQTTESGKRIYERITDRLLPINWGTEREGRTGADDRVRVQSLCSSGKRMKLQICYSEGALLPS